MTEQYVYLDSNLVEKFMCAVLGQIKVSEPDAATVAKVLITADRRGIPSHGFARFKDFYVEKILRGLIDPLAKIKIERNVLGTAVVDAANGLGHPTGKFCMELAIDKASKHGLGMVAVHNSNHYGAAGYYAELAGRSGMIGVTGTNARPGVAPTRGVEAMFGTNPIAFCAPSDDAFPFLFDAATTIAQRGKVETYARLGKTLPEGWVVDSEGKYLTDAKSVLDKLVKKEAALLPIGGMSEELGSHKGFGLAMIVEILSSALQQGNYLSKLSGVCNGKAIPNSLGHFFLAINIECFCELDALKKLVGDMCREIRASKKAPGCSEILTAGMREYSMEEKHSKMGVPFDSQMQNDLIYLRDKFALNNSEFEPLYTDMPS